MRISFTIVFCFLSLISLSQDFGPLPKIEKEKLIRDFDLVFQTLDKFHSGMYWYTPQDSVIHEYRNIRAEINHNLNVLEFNKLVSKLVFLSREDHTNINLSSEASDLKNSNRVILPLGVTFLGKKLYCISNASEKDIAIDGLEIELINGMTPLFISDSLNRINPSDGFIKSKMLADLGGYNFSNDYHLWFGNIDTFDIKFSNIDSIISFKALNGKRINDNYYSRYGKESNVVKDSECLEFKILKDAAYLGIHSFDGDDIKENKTHSNFEKFLKYSFRQIEDQKIKSLIIDLSKNGGGDENNVGKLYAYLGENYKKYKNVIANKYKMTLDNGIDNPITLKSLSPLVRLFGFKRLNNGSIKRKENAGGGDWAFKKDQKKKFDGDIYIIIGPNTYSSASIFSNMMHNNKLATFVGQETGGGYFGNTSGNVRSLELPNSRIEIRVPAIKYEMNVIDSTLFGRGVIPEHEVIPTYQEYKSGKNVALEYILKLLGT